jgi:hypothetical protein
MSAAGSALDPTPQEGAAQIIVMTALVRLLL